MQTGMSPPIAIVAVAATYVASVLAGTASYFAGAAALHGVGVFASGGFFIVAIAVNLILFCPFLALVVAALVASPRKVGTILATRPLVVFITGVSVFVVIGAVASVLAPRAVAPFLISEVRLLLGVAVVVGIGVFAIGSRLLVGALRIEEA